MLGWLLVAASNNVMMVLTVEPAPPGCTLTQKRIDANVLGRRRVVAGTPILARAAATLVEVVLTA